MGRSETTSSLELLAVGLDAACLPVRRSQSGSGTAPTIEWQLSEGPSDATGERRVADRLSDLDHI